jgi:hypothetical protein
MSNEIKISIKESVKKSEYDKFYQYFHDKKIQHEFFNYLSTKDLDIGFGGFIDLGDEIMIICVDPEKRKKIIEEYKKKKNAIDKLIETNQYHVLQKFADFIIEKYI